MTISSETPVFIPAGPDPMSAAVADINGDGRPDLITGSPAGTVSVMLGDGLGGFGAPTTYAAGMEPTMISVADVNGDGNADLVVADEGNGSSDGGVSILYGNGLGGFAPAVFLPGQLTGAVTTADLNGDGRPDIVSVDVFGGVSVMLATATGGLAAPVVYSAGAWGGVVDAVDVNGDGKLDLLIGTSDGVSVLLGRGDGTFGPAIASLAGGRYFQNVGVGDFNGDGIPDIVGTSYGVAYVMLGNGQGGFGTPYAIGTLPSGAIMGLTVADMNGDGHPDVEFATQVPDEAVSLYGLGDGQFVGGAVTPGSTDGNSPWSVTTADLNGDGTPDLVLTNGNDAEIVLNERFNADQLTLRLSEDAYQGDAKFVVRVDGVQIGGVRTVDALHSAGGSDVVSLEGSWGSGAQTVQIQFLNDAYAGSVTQDRNLYVNSIAYNGVTDAGTTALLAHDGSASFSVGGGAPVAAAPADTLTVHLAEDAWKGNAAFLVTVDGKVISSPQTVTDLHSTGLWEDFSFAGNFGTGAHQIGVTFLNDLYGGSVTTDRNLYVDGIDVNGQHYGSGVTTLAHDGSVSFAVSTSS